MVNAAYKKLNEMNSLRDMGHFPVAVNAGATANVLLTIALTWLLVPHYSQPFAAVFWVGIVLLVNLLPVVLLRFTLRPDTNYPPIRRMNFLTDQHKFSDWVYIAASANMAFWILSAWALFSLSHTPATLGGLLVVAFVATFSPVFLRSLRTHYPGSDKIG